MTKEEKALKRLGELCENERPLWNRGMLLVAGADEAGRGPLAGPVVAACVIMPSDPLIPGVDDSKKLSEKRREELYNDIWASARHVGVGIVYPDIIDKINILEATRLAFVQSIEDMGMVPDFLFTDAIEFDVPCQMQPMIRADQKVYNVAAASIIAKVTRDRIMRMYDIAYPGYGFAQHKGYGTKAHRDAILSLGPSPIHRRSFLRKLLG